MGREREGVSGARDRGEWDERERERGVCVGRERGGVSRAGKRGVSWARERQRGV